MTIAHLHEELPGAGVLEHLLLQDVLHQKDFALTGTVTRCERRRPVLAKHQLPIRKRQDDRLACQNVGQDAMHTVVNVQIDTILVPEEPDHCATLGLPCIWTNSGVAMQQLAPLL